MKTHPAWSCYPLGLDPSRRSFLKALATAAAASTLACQKEVAGQQQATATEEGVEIPGAYPKGAALLHFNENPLGPSPKAIAAILENQLRDSNRYNNIAPLTSTVARHHDVSEKQLILGCGSTEFLHIAPWTFLREGHSLVLPDPSYGWSAEVARSMGAEVIRVPLDAEGRVDTKTLGSAFDRHTRLVYLANPNNPTGASLEFNEVLALCEALPAEAVLLVDEAYSPFLPHGRSAIDLVHKDAPVIVTRTFSKAYGLAGLRLGYAIAPERWIEKLKTFWLWDLGINAAVNVAGPAALADEQHVQRYVAAVDQGLERLRSGLNELGFRPLPHRAPFFMVDLRREAKPVAKALEKRSVFVRDGKAWRKPTFLRVSVGRASENEAFLDALRQVL